MWYILVEEGLKFFFEVWWTHLSWLEGFQKSSWKLKNRILGIFCLTTKNWNLHNEVSNFIFFSHHGVNLYWYRHNWAQWVGYLGHKPHICRQKSVTLWQLSHCLISNYYFWLIFWCHMLPTSVTNVTQLSFHCIESCVTP